MNVHLLSRAGARGFPLLWAKVYITGLTVLMLARQEIDICILHFAKLWPHFNYLDRLTHKQYITKIQNVLNILKPNVLWLTVNIRNSQPITQRVTLPADPQFGAIFERGVRRRAGPPSAGTMENLDVGEVDANRRPCFALANVGMSFSG